MQGIHVRDGSYKIIKAAEDFRDNLTKYTDFREFLREYSRSCIRPEFRNKMERLAEYGYIGERILITGRNIDARQEVKLRESVRDCLEKISVFGSRPQARTIPVIALTAPAFAGDAAKAGDIIHLHFR